MFQLYLSCLLLMARAAPPLDTLDIGAKEEVTITTEAITLSAELETEAVITENVTGTPVAPVEIDEIVTTTEAEVPQDNFIITTKEEDNEDGGELISAKHHQNDNAENLISNDTDQKNTIEPQKVSTSTAAPTPPPEPWMSGKERRALVSHLHDLDLESGAALVLTPRQKLALRQELEARRMGLAAWTDLTPWQKLSRAEQRRFNDKYLALPVELQVRWQWINVISVDKSLVAGLQSAPVHISAL